MECKTKRLMVDQARIGNVKTMAEIPVTIFSFFQLSLYYPVVFYRYPIFFNIIRLSLALSSTMQAIMKDTINTTKIINLDKCKKMISSVLRYFHKSSK